MAALCSCGCRHCRALRIANRSASAEGSSLFISMPPIRRPSAMKTASRVTAAATRRCTAADAPGSRTRAHSSASSCQTRLRFHLPCCTSDATKLVSACVTAAASRSSARSTSPIAKAHANGECGHASRRSSTDSCALRAAMLSASSSPPPPQIAESTGEVEQQEQRLEVGHARVPPTHHQLVNRRHKSRVGHGQRAHAASVDDTDLLRNVEQRRHCPGAVAKHLEKGEVLLMRSLGRHLVEKVLELVNCLGRAPVGVLLALDGQLESLSRRSHAQQALLACAHGVQKGLALSVLAPLAETRLEADAARRLALARLAKPGIVHQQRAARVGKAAVAHAKHRLGLVPALFNLRAEPAERACRLQHVVCAARVRLRSLRVCISAHVAEPVAVGKLAGAVARLVHADAALAVAKDDLVVLVRLALRADAAHGLLTQLRARRARELQLGPWRLVEGAHWNRTRLGIVRRHPPACARGALAPLARALVGAVGREDGLNGGAPLRVIGDVAVGLRPARRDRPHNACDVKAARRQLRLHRLHVVGVVEFTLAVRSHGHEGVLRRRATEQRDH
eukprot:6178676-Pleurochrysis_carterae.AAC.2